MPFSPMERMAWSTQVSGRPMSWASAEVADGAMTSETTERAETCSGLSSPSPRPRTTLAM